MKYKYKKILVLLCLIISCYPFLNYDSGPATNGISVTGAPFGNYPSAPSSNYCSSCHSGGSYSPTATIALYYNGVVLPNSNYLPGTAYTLRITRSANSTFNAITNAGFGFQLTCATSPSNADVNNWGTLPSNITNKLLSAHHYIEHTQVLAKTITTIDIPWTAPTGNVGTVKFYLALNSVNGNGSTSGDQAITTTVTYNQVPLSVTWLYFKGLENGGNNLLQWATSNEIGNKFFTIERSENGIDFSELARIAPSNEPIAIHAYNFEDARPIPNAFYRIKQTDLNGNENYFSTIHIQRQDIFSATHFISGNDIVFKSENGTEKNVVVSIFSIDGKLISKNTATLLQGNNLIRISKPETNGMYIISVRDKTENIYTSKFVID